MDFTFSAEQDALREAVRSFLSARVNSEYVRSMADDEVGYTPELWNEMASLGWTSTLIPEDLGGLGLGILESCVILEEMGRVPLPGPYMSSAIMATIAAKHLEATDLLRSLAEGTTKGAIALEEVGYGDPVETFRTRARRRGAGWVANGLKPLVLGGEAADWVIVVARTEEGTRSFLLEKPKGTPVPTMDPTRKATRIDLVDEPVIPIGPKGDQTAIWRLICDDIAVAIAAELVGVSEQAFHLAVEYAKVRVQFGRPIATFQAVKHKTVDMLHAVEMARVAMHYGAWAADTDHPDRARAAAMCKSYAGSAGVKVTGDAIQIHGGVGFTWNCDAHFLYKRAKQDDLLLGGQSPQRKRLARMIIQPE